MGKGDFNQIAVVGGQINPTQRLFPFVFYSPTFLPFREIFGS